MTTGERDDEVYRYVRKTISAMVTGSDDLGDTAVPACPGWRVRDLVAHLVEIASLVIGRYGERADPDAVAAAAEGPVDVVLDAWSFVGEQVTTLVGSGGGGLMVMDAFVHELDLHRALGTAPVPGHPAFARTIDLLVGGMGERLAEHEAPALEVRVGGLTWSLGNGEPEAVVTGADYDVLRSFAGRRTAGQIRSLSWSSDPHPWVPGFTWAAFAPPAAPVEPMVGDHGLPWRWQ